MSTKDDRIINLPAYQLSAQIHSREVSCVEVMNAYLDRIDEVNPKVNAVVNLQERHGLVKQSEVKDAQLKDGKSNGWMHGFPQAIKDLADAEGLPTTWGYRGLINNIAKADSVAIARMKRDGSIVVGKTNSPEWGYGSNTYNEVFGATGNPYNPDLTSGGSSGGAACTLALNMQPVADGSDYMGSLRNPAGYCNIFGYRPSWGRVPNVGFEMFYSDGGILGPMAKNTPDLALLLNTMSGYDLRVQDSLCDDPNLKALTPDNVCDHLKSDIKGKKVAWLGNLDGYLAMEDGVLDVCQSALDKLSGDAGVVVDAVKPFFDTAEFWEKVWLPVRHFSGTALKVFYENPDMRALLKPEALFEYEGSLKYGVQDLYSAGLRRTTMYLAALKVFEDYDFMAIPTAQVFPFDKNVHWPKEIAGRKMDTYHRWMEVVTPWTLIGVPIAAVPAGFNKDGLPMGIQIIGKPRGDWDLLKFTYGYEQVHGEILRRKPEM